MSLREIKTKARRDLHLAMRVPASYYASLFTPPTLIHVRVHTKWVEEGDLKGTNLNYAERESTTPRIVFDRAEVASPPRSSMVIISEEEGYRIGQTEPVDGEFITAEATHLSAADLIGKIQPEDL